LRKADTPASMSRGASAIVTFSGKRNDMETLRAYRVGGRSIAASREKQVRQLRGGSGL
jgi:hypothetical protein